MKRVKVILSWLVAVSMFLPMFPIQARAEITDMTSENTVAYAQNENEAQITDYVTFLKNLKILEEYAQSYSRLNPGKDPVALVLKYVRTGVDGYNSGLWNNMAGYEDAGFAAYVASQEAAASVTGLKNLRSFAVPNGDVVDMGRLFGVMDASYHNGGSAVYADAAGWAGDLVDLLVQADSNGVSGTLEEMVEEISGQYFLNSGSFSQAEYAADLDGYHIMRELTGSEYESGMLCKIISGYFTQSLTDEQRAAYFLKNRLGGVSSRSDIRDAVFGGYTGNQAVAALESGKTFVSDELSDLRKACCYAFADYLCKLAGDYVQIDSNRYYSVISSEKTTLSPGITKEIFKAETADDKQIVYYLATADISSQYVNVYVNYKNNDPSQGWGMQSVRDQANAAEARHSDPSSEVYIPNYDVIAAVNGAGYNMTTGEPRGLLVMEGVEYHAPDDCGFFGILKDGSAFIGTTAEYYALKAQEQVMEGIAIFGTTLVRDGKVIVGHSDSYTSNRASRTAVGITKTGKVVFMVLDGRQEPVSCGGSMEEIAQIMLEAGCVEAVNLDGGGSTTFLAQQPGDDGLSLVNNPSDGFERSVSASMIMVSTMPSATDFDHAELDSEVQHLTVGSEVQITASGISAAGSSVEIPAGAAWSVSDSTVASISADGVLTGLKNGQVDVNLTLGGKTVGTRTMYVVVPDAVYFTSENMDVTQGATVTLPVAALYEGKQVAIQENDLSFSLSNASAGTISGFNFTAAANSGIKNVTVTATAAQNSAASGSMRIGLYGKNDTFFDFDAAYGERQLAWTRQVSNATTEDGLTYLAVNTASPMVSSYSFAIDASKLPIPEKQASLIYSLLGVSPDANSSFLLQLAESVSTATELSLVVQFDSNLDVNIKNVTLASELFTLEGKELDAQTNALTLTLKWKDQSGTIDPESVSSVCVISGIEAAPKSGASWDSRNRLGVVNNAKLLCDIYLQEAESSISFETSTYSDEYTLINGQKNGWVYEDGGYAYYVDDTRYTGVQKAGKFYYDFGETGINIGQTKYTGLFRKDNIRYYAKDGVLTSGWYIVGDEYYCFDENGAGYDGKVIVDEVELEFDNGLQTGGHTGFVKKANGYTYHYTNGKMDYGWVYVGEELYHFSTNTGTMTTGTHVIPDEEASAKGAYYDFADDGRTLRGYFNGFGYYYWAGLPRANDWVKSGADPDPDAWYRTNGNGHFVTDGTGKETFDLELNGKTYKAVKIECEGVVYTFDTTNGKLLLGSFVFENNKWYYYWAGSPVNDGWFEMDGNTYYAYEDGHLATGSNTIGDQTYMFTSQGALVTDGVIMTAVLTDQNGKMTINVENADADLNAVRIAVWAVNAGQADTLKWLDAEKTSDGKWTVTIPMCQFDVDSADTYEIHAYGVTDAEAMLVNTTVDVPAAVTHSYSNAQDATCNFCREEREIKPEPQPEPGEIKTTPMYRLYNPNSGEHFYTGSVVERDNLVAAGWQYEGIAWNAPTNSGDPVYRLFNPNNGDHHYTMSAEERDMLVGVGWQYEGVAWNSASPDNLPLYRLFNPNADCGSHHYTGSTEERDFLVSVGWIYEGIGWFGMLR